MFQKLKKIIIFLFIYSSTISLSHASPWGKGELILEDWAADAFIEYVKGKIDKSPGVFLVATDGDGVSYWYCGDGLGNCQPGSYTQMILHCEQHWQKECKPFASKRTIKWKNGINPGKGKQSRINSKWSDNEIKDKLRELGFLR